MIHWVGAQGQANLAKKAKTCSHYDITHRKLQSQNKKKFLNLNQKMCRICRGFELLSSSISWQVIVLQVSAGTEAFARLEGKPPRTSGYCCGESTQ